ncbi:hypothetical protein ACRAWF_20000 [Streptomyces sp. L7]
MGKNGHHEITDVSYRPSLGAPIGMDVLDFAELLTRGERRGLDLSAPQRPDFHHLIHVTEGRLRHRVGLHGLRRRTGRLAVGGLRAGAPVRPRRPDDGPGHDRHLAAGLRAGRSRPSTSHHCCRRNPTPVRCLPDATSPRARVRRT